MSLPVPEVSGALDGTSVFQWTPPNNWKPLEGDASTGPTATRAAGGPYNGSVSFKVGPYLLADAEVAGKLFGLWNMAGVAFAFAHLDTRRVLPDGDSPSIATPPAMADPRGGERRSCRPAPA